MSLVVGLYLVVLISGTLNIDIVNIIIDTVQQPVDHSMPLNDDMTTPIYSDNGIEGRGSRYLALYYIARHTYAQ